MGRCTIAAPVLGRIEHLILMSFHYIKPEGKEHGRAAQRKMKKRQKVKNEKSIFRPLGALFAAGPPIGPHTLGVR